MSRENISFYTKRHVLWTELNKGSFNLSHVWGLISRYLSFLFGVTLFLKASTALMHQLTVRRSEGTQLFIENLLFFIMQTNVTFLFYIACNMSHTNQIFSVLYSHSKCNLRSLCLHLWNLNLQGENVTRSSFWSFYLR